MITYEVYPKVALETLVHDLQFDLSELDLEAGINLLRRSAGRMCREADLARRKAHIRTQAEVVNYRLEPPDEDVVLSAILNARRADGGAVKRWIGPPEGHRSGVWFQEPNEIFIRGHRCGCYEVEFSVAPREGACSIDAGLAGDYYELLLLGARALAYDLAGKSWSDAARAQSCLAQFQKSLSAAKINRMTGRQKGRLRINWGRAL